MILVVMLVLAMTPAAAGATDNGPVIDRSGRFDHGVIMDRSGMKGTIIGAYLQRNAGTGVWTNPDEHSQNWLVRWDTHGGRCRPKSVPSYPPRRVRYAVVRSSGVPSVGT